MWTGKGGREPSRSPIAGVCLGVGFAAALAGFGIAAGPGFALHAGEEARPIASAEQQPLDFAFYRANVEPIFTRPRGGFVGGSVACAACHTWQTTTPLNLEPLETDADGRVYWTEEQSRRNFEVVSRLVTPGDPDESRLLRKPLSANAGGVGSHTGGIFWQSKEDPEWQLLAEWVRMASPAATAAAPPPPEPDLQFFRSCVQPIFVNPIEGAVACYNCHGGGGNRAFARPPAAGGSAWTEEESRASYEALMELVEPGHPEYTRFLHHPLAREGGGDFMHNGGRRWQSTDDAEWQALAAWVRGEASGSTCPPALQF